MTLKNPTRTRRRPSNHQINGATPQAPVAAVAAAAAAVASVPDGQTESNMTNEERAAQLKEKVDFSEASSL